VARLAKVRQNKATSDETEVSDTTVDEFEDDEDNSSESSSDNKEE